MEQHFAQAKWQRNPGLDGLVMMLPDDAIPGLRLPFAKLQTPLHPGYDVTTHTHRRHSGAQTAQPVSEPGIHNPGRRLDINSKYRGYGFRGHLPRRQAAAAGVPE